jgi:SAM-dependent methyltransferase|tara:strand:- start:1891 stop:2490 length:600 start_codon:yes stop_codon:yes gene_type:complete
MRKELFTKKYFQTINYTNYLERSKKYVKHAEDIIQLLESISLTTKKSRILDYGCAVGFLIEGLNEKGYKNVEGFDISEWAVNECKAKGLDVTDKFTNQDYDLMMVLDVFEHMTDEEISTALKYFKSNLMLVRIPCSVNGEDFHLDISKLDPTHCNCKTKKEWEELLRKYGYNIFLKLNASTIYDTPGVISWLCIKESTN